MCYIYLFNSTKGDLVEAYKKKDDVSINIISLEYNEDYMMYIVHNLKLFANYYCNFIECHELKMSILTCHDEISFE